MKKILMGLALASAGTAFAANDGLSGTYYNPGADATGWWDGFTQTIDYLDSNPQASGTFIGTVLNYNGGDGTSIKTWLGTDASSFIGTNGNLSDGVIVLKGWIDLGAGSTTLSVNHDDGFRLVLDGSVLGQGNCCGITDLATTSYASAGWHAIEIDYNNAYYGGFGGANFGLWANGQAIQASALATVVPEPQDAALLLAGLALVGTVARRRQAR